MFKITILAYLTKHYRRGNCTDTWTNFIINSVGIALVNVVFQYHVCGWYIASTFTFIKGTMNLLSQEYFCIKQYLIELAHYIIILGNYVQYLINL